MNKSFRCTTACMAWLLTACGGSSSNAPATPPSVPALVTPVGASAGAAVSQAIGAAGGSVGIAGASVSAPPGAFASGGTLTLEPVMDTLNGAGQAVAIRADVAWDQPLTVTLPIGADDGPAENLGLAAQQADGSWLVLSPVRVDAAAGTLSAGLSTSMLAQPAAAAAPIRAAAAPRRPSTTVTRFWRFDVQPRVAEVGVGKSQTFRAFAQGLRESDRPACHPTAPAPTPPDCPVHVGPPLEFNNVLAGYTRTWSVEVAGGGFGSAGSLAPNGDFGAVYTAPPEPPDGGLVQLSFDSQFVSAGGAVDPLRHARATAAITVTRPVARYTGTLHFSYQGPSVDSPYVPQMTVQVGIVDLDLVIDPDDSTRFRQIGTARAVYSMEPVLPTDFVERCDPIPTVADQPASVELEIFPAADKTHPHRYALKARLSTSGVTTCYDAIGNSGPVALGNNVELDLQCNPALTLPMWSDNSTLSGQTSYACTTALGDTRIKGNWSLQSAPGTP